MCTAHRVFPCCYLYLRFRQEGTLPLRACPCFLGLFFAGGAKGVDVGLVVQGFVGCGGGEFGADVVGIAAVAGLPVFKRGGAAGGAERECDGRGDVAAVFHRQRLAVCAVCLLQDEQIYGDRVGAAVVLRSKAVIGVPASGFPPKAAMAS